MTEEKVYLDAVEEWRRNKGVGTFVIPAPFDSLKPLLYLLPAIYNKSPTIRTVVVVNDFVDKDKVKDYLTKQGTNHDAVFEQLINSGYINIITNISDVDIAHLNSIGLVVIYNPSGFLYCHLALLENAHFKLVIITKRIDDDAINNFYSVCHKVGNFSQSVIDDLRKNRPVEELLVGFSIDESSEFSKQLYYYNREISTGIAIFGNFDNIKYARLGNSVTNCSSATICDAIARQNGWNENLDKSAKFDMDIDELYNPNAIKERADNIYNLIRERSILLACSKDKLISIRSIVADNRDKKILVINKYPDYANTVTEYLNDNFSDRVCMNYHDRVESIPAVDDYGNPILIKSGAKKGQPKMLGVTSQKKMAQKYMNTNKIHVLSCNAAPDKSLDVDIDVIIITSPLCDTVESYLYRLSKVHFANKVTLYTLYYKSTLEEKRLVDRTIPPNHTIINKDELNVKVENNFSYCVVD